MISFTRLKMLMLQRRRIRPEVVLLFFLVSFPYCKTSYVATQEILQISNERIGHKQPVVRRDTTGQTENSTQCPIICQGVKQRPVCASDGVTYSSKCELRHLRDCEKKELRVVSKGRCPGETKCQEERRTARFDMSQRPGQDIYISECKADGSYMETQCHDGTGYCWCVRKDGKPIPGTSVEGQNTDCKKRGKQKAKNYPGSIKQRRGVGSKDCSSYGRSMFNINLIKRFHEEYSRAPKSVHQTTEASQPTGSTGTPHCQGDAESCMDRKVVEWKFSELDQDKDTELKRTELKTLRYLVNKIVEPHACALSFLDYCDWDNNKRITLHEWSKCLRVVHTSANGSTTGAMGPKNRNVPSTQRRLGDKRFPRVKPGPSKSIKQNSSKTIDLSQKRGRMPLKTFLDLKGRPKNTLKPSGPRIRPQENEQKDSQQGQTSSEAPSRLGACEEERQKAKEMDKADPDGHIFIPECEPSGMFKKAQCHNSTGYCWCVDEKTGIPIPGISTHNVTPDCSDAKTNILKGCPFSTKKRFLTELLDHITQEMVERANNGTSASQLNEPDPEQSIEERAVRWKLGTMDANHNGVLEKGEWKDFKEEIKRLRGEEKYMRKCRRNFVQYCDEDNNSKITMTEWVNCMGLNEQQRNLPENPKRRGKNPFSTVLKS